MTINADIIPSSVIRKIEFHTACYDLIFTKKRIHELFEQNNIKIIDIVIDDGCYCQYGESIYIIEGSELNLTNLFWKLKGQSFILEHFLEDIREQDASFCT